jgi:hypothetical protein
MVPEPGPNSTPRSSKNINSIETADKDSRRVVKIRIDTARDVFNRKKLDRTVSCVESFINMEKKLLMKCFSLFETREEHIEQVYLRMPLEGAVVLLPSSSSLICLVAFPIPPMMYPYRPVHTVIGSDIKVGKLTL